MKKAILVLAIALVLGLLSCTCGMCHTANASNSSMSFESFACGAVPIDDDGRQKYDSHGMPDYAGATKFIIIDRGRPCVDIFGSLSAKIEEVARVDANGNTRMPTATCISTVVTSDGRALQPMEGYANPMVGDMGFDDHYENVTYWFGSGDCFDGCSYFDPRWFDYQNGQTYYVDLSAACYPDSEALDKSPYPILWGSFTCYLLPRDGDVPQYDCHGNCTNCLESASANPPKPGIKAFASSSKDTSSGTMSLDWFLPDGPDLLKEVRTGLNEVKVIFRTQYHAGVGTRSFSGSAGTLPGVAGPPVYIYKWPVTPGGSNHYPDTQAWSLVGYGTVTRTQRTEVGDIKYTIRRNDGLTCIACFGKLPGPSTFEQVTRPKIIGYRDDPSFTEPQGWTYDSQGRPTSYTDGIKVFQVTYPDPTPQGESQIVIHYPDGSYAIITYYADTNAQAGEYAGQAKRVDSFSQNDLLMSSISYHYDDKGRIKLAQKGDRQVSYLYDDADQTVIYTELSTSPRVQTVYHYGDSGGDGTNQPRLNETWVIRKHEADDVTSFEDGDRRIRYEFNPDKSLLVKYTDPLGNTTEYGLEDLPPDFTGKSQQRVQTVTDPSGLVTKYQFDDEVSGIANPQGNVVKVSEYKETAQSTILYQANLDYYTDASGTTQWLKSINDASGTVVLERDDFDNYPWRVDAVKIQNGVDASNHPIYETVRQFEYYGGTSQDIASSITPTWDHAYSDLDARPEKLYDGDAGAGHEDVGNWDYSAEFYGDEDVDASAFCFGNASSWEWSQDRAVTGINLYIAQSMPGLYQPAAVRVYSKDGQGNYTNIIYETTHDMNGGYLDWQPETWQGKTVDAVHIDLSSQPVTTKGLRIVYGNYAICHLGEVEIMAQSTSDQSVIEKLNVTCSGEHAYSDPDMRPSHLNDGLIGSGHEDAGDWDYGLQGSQGLYASDYSHANASTWEWNGDKRIDQVVLYAASSITGMPGAILPEAVRIYAKDDQGDYSTLVYATPAGQTGTWASGTLGGQNAEVLHIKLGVLASGLKIIYGAGQLCHLGEVQIVTSAAASGDGKPGQLKKVIVPDVDADHNSAWVEFKYGQNGKILDKPTQFVYPYYNPSTQTYESKTSSVQYDDAGRVIAATDANNRSIAMAYDIIAETESGQTYGHRLNTLTYTQNAKKQVHGSCCGSDWYSDEDGRKIHLTYDQAGRPTNAWVDGTGQNASSPLVSLGADPEAPYDVFNKVAAVSTLTKSGGTARTSAYGYDDDGRPVSLSYPGDLIGDEQIQYDSVGNLMWSKDGKDRYTLFHYDDLHRLDKIAYSNTAPSEPYDGSNPAISLVPYADSGLLHEVRKETDLAASFEYDYKGRMTSYTPAGHAPLGYSYNNLDQVTQLTTGDYNVHYDYFVNGLLRSVSTVIGGNTVPLATYTYDAAGLLQYIDYGNGVRCTPSYGADDPRYPLSSITYTKGANTLGSFGYTGRDNSLNPRSITDTMSVSGLTVSGTTTFDAYGPLGELTNATYQNPTPDQPVGGPYLNDWVGNRTSPPSGANAMVYNDVDQLVAWPGMHGIDADTPGYVYDANGNLTAVKNAAGTADVVTYIYDEDSNLLETASYNGHTFTNTWDVFGNRSGIHLTKPDPLHPGQTISEDYSFTYNIAAGVPAVIEEVKSGGNTYYYYRDPGGALIARRDASEENSLQYYHYDELGSTRIITDKNGQVTDTYSYDAYGSVISHVGSTTDNPYQYVGALGYYTHYQDPDFKLLQLGYRFYDPETGRFTQQDPAGDGINWYAYCGGNPMAGVDPWGLYSWGLYSWEMYSWEDFLRWFGGHKGDLADENLQVASNFYAGWGDTLTFGGTGLVREWVGVNDVVDEGGGWYKAGEWTGLAHTIAFGVAGGLKAAGAKGAGKEFSHFIPKRMGGPRSLLNGNFVTPARHFLHDPFRYPIGWKSMGRKLPVVIAQLDRIPNLFRGAITGITWGLVGGNTREEVDCPDL